MDQQELERLTVEKRYLFLKEELEKTNEVDIAELLEPLDIHTTLLIFRMLPKDLAVNVFAHFSVEKQKNFVCAPDHSFLNTLSYSTTLILIFSRWRYAR